MSQNANKSMLGYDAFITLNVKLYSLMRLTQPTKYNKLQVNN